MKRRIGSGSGVMPRFGRTWIAVQAALAVALVGYLLANQGVRSPFAADPWRVEVVLADASGLDESDRSPVTVAGVESGRVTDVSYEDGAHKGHEASTRVRNYARFRRPPITA